MAILTIGDLAKRYKLSKTCVRNYFNAGILPAGFKLGASRRWNSDDLDAFDKAQSKKQKISKGDGNMKAKIAYELKPTKPELKDDWDTEEFFDKENGIIFWISHDSLALNKIWEVSLKMGGLQRAIRVANRFDAKLLEKLLSGEFTGEVEISA